MTDAPSRAIALFGTEEPVTPVKLLRAGPLTAELDRGNLRAIRIGGQEAIRALAFIVRDKDWGTYSPTIENLKIGQASTSFEVSYEALCDDGRQALRYRARITGSSDGSLRFEGEAEALTDFVTNRTGFVVLHPIEGVAGCPVEVERVDGSRERSTFPELIDPICPFQDLRALAHEVLPGVTVTCTMTGDAYETEDHRNWNDASFKTYVRPLAKPWPYTLKAGETTAQSVTLTIQGQAPAVRSGDAPAPVRLTVGGPAGTMPKIGLSLPPDQRPAILERLAVLQALGPQFLVCPFDSRIAAGRPAAIAGPRVSTFPLDAEGIGGPGEVPAMFKAAAEACGAALVLEAVLACRDDAGGPSADAAIMERDLDLVRDAVERAGLKLAKVAVSPACDLKCTLPGSIWPPCPEAAAIYRAARAAFPGIPLGGGMFSFFTELNRKRPPAELLDFIQHTTSPIVHASDDLSVMENLEALPHIIRSTRALAAGRPYLLGPSAIGARDNPYGAAAAPNPQNGRVALARMDPRQRGLLGAAWHLGYLAHAARGGVEAVALGAPVGEFGVAHAPMPWPQPWFDQHGGVYPVFHVLRGAAAAAGRPYLACALSDGAAVQALAYEGADGPVVWLANLTGRPVQVEIEGLPAQLQARRLDLASFAAAAGPDGLQLAPCATGSVELGPYATLCLAAR
jgi:hypothetical protein